MSRDMIEKLINQQSALAKFGSFAFRSTDLQFILDSAASICGASVNALCKVCRYRPEHDDLIIEAGFGWKPGVVGSKIPSKADRSSPTGRAFRTRTSNIFADVNQIGLELPSYYTDHHIISVVNVVIQGSNGDTPYGILEIDSKELQVYDEQDVNFLTGFANVLAEAVATQRRIVNLQNALEEKDVLSRELQHRVRNNLHLIHSMLDIEIMNGETPGLLDRCRNITNRVKALSTVYDHLLGTGMARSLAFDQYLDRLCSALRAIQPESVELQHRSTSTAMIDLDVTTILGIAITEIITNSFKHAFPNGQKGVIEVGLKEQAIVIADNGVGIDTTLLQATKRHGLGLVYRLVEQINGSLNIHNTTSGTRCEIRLPA